MFRDFCICMYLFGRRLSPFRLCGSDFGITPVDDITNGITWAVFCFHIAHISFASSWNLLLLLLSSVLFICCLKISAVLAMCKLKSHKKTSQPSGLQVAGFSVHRTIWLPGFSIWDLRWTEEHRDRLLSENFCIFCQSSFHHCSSLILWSLRDAQWTH